MSIENYIQTIKSLNAGLSKRNNTIIYENETRIYSDLPGYSQAIKEHYNDIYNPDNGTPGITVYLKQSLIREIFQNIIDCTYESSNISINVSFDDSNNIITFKYNELGFSVADIISFLSMNHTSKDKYNTGAFGTGAKGAMLSAEETVIDSYRYNRDINRFLHTHISIKTCNISEISTIQINELNINYENNTDIKNGTILSIKLKDSLYNDVKDNLLSFDKSKGDYITPIDFMFASTKKINSNIFLVIDKYYYSIYSLNQSVNFKNLNNGIGVSLNLHSGKSSRFTYLLPAKRFSKDMPNYITDWHYNIFSTYELTGQLSNDQKYLPNFFINIPTRDLTESDNDKSYYITSDRTAIKENKKDIVERYIINDIKGIIKYCSDNYLFYFDKNESVSYCLKFLYEYIEYKMKNSVYYKDSWKYLIRLLNESVYIQYDNQYIKLTDFSIYSNNTLYPDISTSSKPIIIKSKKDFRTFGYSFAFYNNNERLFTISEEVLKSNFEANNFNKLIIRLLLSHSFLNTNPIWMLNLENLLNQNKFDQYILKKLLSIIKNNTSIKYAYFPEEHILHIDGKDFEFTDEFIFNDLSILPIIYSENLKPLKIHLIELFSRTILNKSSDPLSILKKYQESNDDITFEYEDPLNSNLLSIKYKNDILHTINVSLIKDYKSLKNVTSLEHYEWFVGKKFDLFFTIGNKVFNNINDNNKISNLTNNNDLFSFIDSLKFTESSILDNIKSDLLVTVDANDTILSISTITKTNKLDLCSNNKVYIISGINSSSESIKYRILELIDNSCSLPINISSYFEKHVIEPMSISELETFFDEKAKAIISFYLNKAVALQPEILESQNKIPPIQIPKEHIEQWIVQAIDGIIHVGSGHTPVDIIKPGEYGADIKMLSCKIDKENNLIPNQFSNETSIAQNFDTAGSDLDDKFWNGDYESILEGWINVLKTKLIDYKNQNKIKDIYYFILLRAGNKFYLCGCKINTDYLDNLSVLYGTEKNVFVKGYINENLGNVKIYKAKKRMELRLLPHQWVTEGLTLKFEIPDNRQHINLRDLDLEDLNKLGNDFIQLSCKYTIK